MNIFSQLFAACKSKKSLLTIISIIVGILLFPEYVLAADRELLSAEDSSKVIGIVNGFLIGAASIMGLVTSFVSIFLYPGWVNGTLFGLQEYLREIWILVSNVVYFIFAFIIIVIAFMNIIGKGEGNWELKQAMPRFIIGILIVPFSWFFVQFTLAISAILTVGVLTLPYDSFQDDALLSEALSDTTLGSYEICKSVEISFSGEFSDTATSLTSGGDDILSEQIKCKSEGDKVTVEQIFTGEGGADGLDNSIFGVISVYTYGILKVQELDTLAADDLTTVKKLADLVFKVLFDLLFVIVFLLLMIALFLALLVRGIRLWVYAMLSPTFGLLYFFGKSSEGVGSDEKFSIKEFVSLAMVPVLVAAALSFGLIFILVATQGIKDSASTDDLDTIEAGGFSLTIIGAHGDGEQEVSVIGKMIVQLFGVVILWIAVMAALKTSSVTKAAVEPIAAFGKSMGDLAKKAPTYAPIIPTPSGMQSAASLKTIGSSIQSAAAGAQAQRAQTFMDNSPLVGGGGAADSVQRLSTAAGVAAGNIERFSEQPQRVMEELRDLLRTDGRGTLENIRISEDAQEAIRLAGTNLGMAQADVDGLSFRNDREILDALAAIDRAAEDRGLSTGIFEGRFARGAMDKSTYETWLAGGAATGTTETTEETTINTGAITIALQANEIASNQRTAAEQYFEAGISSEDAKVQMERAGIDVRVRNAVGNLINQLSSEAEEED